MFLSLIVFEPDLAGIIAINFFIFINHFYLSYIWQIDKKIVNNLTMLKVIKCYPKINYVYYNLKNHY